MDRRRRPGTGAELRGNTANYDLLSAAIANRELVNASYTGFRRDFCPHVLGRHEGRYRVVGWQYGGGSPEGRAPAWRCFELDHLRNVTSRPGKWRTGDPAAAPRDCLDTVEAVAVDFDVSSWPAELALPEEATGPLPPLEKLSKKTGDAGA